MKKCRNYRTWTVTGVMRITFEAVQKLKLFCDTSVGSGGPPSRQPEAQR